MRDLELICKNLGFKIVIDEERDDQGRIEAWGVSAVKDVGSWVYAQQGLDRLEREMIKMIEDVVKANKEKQ